MIKRLSLWFARQIAASYDRVVISEPDLTRAQAQDWRYSQIEQFTEMLKGDRISPEEYGAQVSRIVSGRNLVREAQERARANAELIPTFDGESDAGPACYGHNIRRVYKKGPESS